MASSRLFACPDNLVDDSENNRTSFVQRPLYRAKLSAALHFRPVRIGTHLLLWMAKLCLLSLIL